MEGEQHGDCKRMLVYIRKTLFILNDFKFKLPLLLFLFVIIALFEVVGLGLIGPYVSILQDQGDISGYTIITKISQVFEINKFENNKLFFGVLLLFVFLFKSIIVIFVKFLITKFCTSQCADLRFRLIQNYQIQKYSKFVSRNSSEYLRNLTLSEQFSTKIIGAILSIICDLIILIFIIILLAKQNILALILVLLIFLPFGFFWDRLFKPILVSYGKRSNQYSKLIYKSLNEAINGFKEIRVLGVQSTYNEIVKDISSKYAWVITKSQVIKTSPKSILEFLLVLFIVLLVATNDFVDGTSASLFPTVAMFGFAGLRIVPAINVIIGGLSSLRYSKNTVDVLYEDLQESSFNNNSDQIPEIFDFISLEAKNLSFHYGRENEKILDGVNIIINKSDRVGILGPSGSGKTTLIDTLLGLLEPCEGDLIINGKPVNNIPTNFLSKVAYLPQESFIVDGDIRSNVAFGLTQSAIDENLVIDSLKKAKLYEYISKLKDGIFTNLGERGIRLSGGQKQRISLARAFYHKREIFVMDESTSSLDNKTETAIVDSMQQIGGEITMVIIAHRIETLKYCNKLFKLDNGALSFLGNYNDFISKNE